MHGQGGGSGRARQVPAAPLTPPQASRVSPPGLGFPVSVLGVLQQQVLVCQAPLQWQRRKSRERRGGTRYAVAAAAWGGRAGKRASKAESEERGGGRRSPGAPESRGPGVQSAGRAGEAAAWGSVPLGPSPSGGRGGPALRREAAAWRRGPGAGPASRACRDGCGEDIAGGWHGGPRGVRRVGMAALVFPRRPQCGVLPSERRGRPAGQGRPRPRAELRIRRSRSQSGHAQGTPGPGGSDPRGRVAQRPPPRTLSGKAERILPAGGASPRGEFDEGRPGPEA
jgi:hypothetical protein